MPKNLKLKIGDITIGIERGRHAPDFELPAAYQPFIENGRTDLRLKLHIGFPEIRIGEKVFDSAPVWSLYRHKSGLAVKISDDYSDVKRLLVLQYNLKKADLYLSEAAEQFVNPFFGPTMELLMIHYLTRGKGSILHACGIKRYGQGILFAGESGAGKSTMAKMWDPESGVKVLSDDRTMVRKKDGEFRMYGTPWHGLAEFGSPKSVKLERIFFLRHGVENSARTLKATEIVSEFLKCSFPPYWDAEGMGFTLEFFSELAAGVDCRELTFKPDRSVLEFINRIVF